MTKIFKTIFILVVGGMWYVGLPVVATMFTAAGILLLMIELKESVHA